MICRTAPPARPPLPMASPLLVASLLLTALAVGPAFAAASERSDPPVTVRTTLVIRVFGFGIMPCAFPASGGA